MKTSITVDAKREEARIDRRIYGHFIENMARCIYDGLLRNQRPGDPRGPWKLREEIVDYARELDPPVVRWPGGLYADGYNWRDGVGPADARPLKRNRYWSRYGPLTRVLDPNVFGTHEYMSLVEDLGAEAYVNVNFGTGSAVEAARWVEYVNGAESTTEGARRAGYGRKDPWGVRLWGIGNEMYGVWALGHLPARDYARRYLEFRGAMEEVDPNLEFVAVGADHYLSRDWNTDVLSVAGDSIDLLALHVYLPGMERIVGVKAAQLRGGSAAMYKAIVASPVEYERRLRQMAGDIENVVGAESPVGIAFDEWNLWWSPEQLLLPRWKLRDALFACGVFHAMHRLAGRVKMANIAQLVNVLGVITTRGNKICRTALYYPFLMYSRLAGPVALGIDVTCGSFESPRVGGIPAMTNVPELDCSSTLSDDGKTMVIFAINRNPQNDIDCSIEIKGFSPAKRAEVHCLSGPSVDSINTFADDGMVRVRVREADVAEVLPTCRFPAHSATAVVLKS
ncbi:MAG: alpha-L-arabinofuranosidase C-terminal domain-containing protein [Candidatus Geothermincolia bacterium]